MRVAAGHEAKNKAAVSNAGNRVGVPMLSNPAAADTGSSANGPGPQYKYIGTRLVTGTWIQ